MRQSDLLFPLGLFAELFAVLFLIFSKQRQLASVNIITSNRLTHLPKCSELSKECLFVS
jgi:hypothetical protein